METQRIEMNVENGNVDDDDDEIQQKRPNELLF